MAYSIILMNGKKRIIVADDEPYVTATLATKLRQAGHEVFTAGDGQQTLALAMENLPDLIITDYQMPVMSGYEMSLKLKENQSTSRIPILMLTARGHHLSAQQLALTNIRAIFPKPFSARELVSKVDELLSQPASV